MQHKISGIFLIICFFLFGMICSVHGSSESDSVEAEPRIIIVTLSGVRNVDSIDDPVRQFIPQLTRDVFPEGTLYTNLVDLNYQFHMPTVCAINTGFYHPVFMGVTHPPIFEYIQKQLLWPVEKVWSIGHWKEWNVVLSNEEEKESPYVSQLGWVAPIFSPQLVDVLSEEEKHFVERFRDLMAKGYLTWNQWDSLGKVQFRFFKKILRTHKPNFVHYIMNNVDSAHFGAFSRYAMSLKEGDREIAELFKIINEDPYYKGKTYLFVSPDHERNRYYMNHHDHQSDNRSPVWLYVYGPGVPKGQEVEREVHHVDLFTTCAALLNLQTPENDGRILNECL